MKRKFSLLFIINLKQILVIKQKKKKFSLVKYKIINIVISNNANHDRLPIFKHT